MSSHRSPASLPCEQSPHPFFEIEVKACETEGLYRRLDQVEAAKVRDYADRPGDSGIMTAAGVGSGMYRRKIVRTVRRSSVVGPSTREGLPPASFILSRSPLFPSFAAAPPRGLILTIPAPIAPYSSPCVEKNPCFAGRGRSCGASKMMLVICKISRNTRVNKLSTPF